jgi:hypothetical protein
LGQLGRAASSGGQQAQPNRTATSSERFCGTTLQLAQGLLEAHVFDGVFDARSIQRHHGGDKPSTTESMAALPRRVAETRSQADGTLPRWM